MNVHNAIKLNNTSLMHGRVPKIFNITATNMLENNALIIQQQLLFCIKGRGEVPLDENGMSETRQEGEKLNRW